MDIDPTLIRSVLQTTPQRWLHLVEFDAANIARPFTGRWAIVSAGLFTILRYSFTIRELR